MLSSILIFIIGLALLVKGSDFFVESSARIARVFGISEFVIGLVLIGIGTSLPELAASVTAAIDGNPAMALGNVVGSNIANIGLILGISSTIVALKIKSEIFYRDGAVMLGVAVLFCLFALDGVISRFDGFVLLLIFVSYVAFLLKFRPRLRRLREFRDYVRSSLHVKGVEKRDVFGEFVDKIDFTVIVDTVDDILDGISVKWVLKLWNPKKYLRLAKRTKERLMKGMVGELTIALVGLVSVVYGARFLVAGALDMASRAGIPEGVVGLTIVSLGTSLPELVTALTSLKKGYSNILIGSIIGSNISNITLILGVSALVTSIPVSPVSLLYTIFLMVLLTILYLVFIRSNWEIRRREGLVLLSIYIGFILWIIQSSLLS